MVDRRPPADVPPPPGQAPPSWNPHGQGPEDAHDVPWRWWEALPIVVLTIAVAGVVLALLQSAAPRLAEPLSLPLSGGIVLLATLVWVRLRHPQQVRELFGPRPPTWRIVLAGLVHGLAAFFLVIVVFGSLLQFVAGQLGVELPEVQEELQRAARDRETAPYLVVAVLVMAPLGEEVFFRGLLFQALRRHLHLWPAIGVSAIAFALSHVEPVAVLVIFPLGMYLAWLFHRTGTLVAPIVAHAAFNGMTVALMFAGVR